MISKCSNCLVWTLTLVTSVLVAASGVYAKQVISVKMFSPDLYEWHAHEAARFMEAYPDIEIEVEQVAGGANGLSEVVTLGIATGNAPDVVDNPLRVYYPWADAGLLVDLLPLMESSEIAHPSLFVPGIIETKKYKGKLYSAPTHFDPPTTVFQGRWFDEAGLRDPYELYKSDEWCWETGLAAAQKVLQQSPDGSVARWGWVMSHSTDWSWQAHIVTNGGYTISDDMKLAQLTSEPVVNAIQWMADAYNVHGVGTFRGTRVAPWNAIAMATRGATAAERIPEGAPRVQTAPIAPPQCGGAAAGIVFTDGPILFDNGEDSVAASWKYVEWLMSPEAVETLARVSPGRLPGRIDTLPAWGDIAAEVFNFPTDEIQNVITMYNDIAQHSRLLPFGSHFPEMMSVLNPAIRDIMNGQADTRLKLEETQPVVQAVLTKHHGN